MQQLAGSSTLIAARQRCRIERRQTAQSHPCQRPRYGRPRDPQLGRDMRHRPAALAQRDHPLRGAVGNRARRAMRPRAPIAKPGVARGTVAQQSLAHTLAIGVAALGYRTNRFTSHNGRTFHRRGGARWLFGNDLRGAQRSTGSKRNGSDESSADVGDDGSLEVRVRSIVRSRRAALGRGDSSDCVRGSGPIEACTLHARAFSTSAAICTNSTAGRTP